MRIIGGSRAGLRLHPPSVLPVRPTTDMAKEALFNVLQHRMDFAQIRALDLFSGTGGIAFELASRGASSVVAVDIHFKCVQYINATAKKLDLTAIKAVKADVLKFITTCKEEFDFIFIDPPYELPQLPQLPEQVITKKMLKPGAILVLEHSSTRGIGTHPNLIETRKYGYSSFSFYQV
ncbi:RsmD family RNA methyltransferase [Parapedobacter indicus]|uniref:16S rRNA (Guanine(966)-N(2))-methyltransferase RsmD n=1 Tax=Parapedobacter indicus TaxID=1477437 RepID=A0A1I3R5B3_9SPHI|nr:RsmD family RNA methyltransferase [Parapedobacter indicus]PPL00375.1 16S rRNA (guanine(966)-N(2))-methyltransferase RsmD [Parapedobacter indicus]SFJ41803.1 16S rRNA (guanine(966)-N(2))-methyltransferase RsmD [Parapedobacter indicus]